MPPGHVANWKHAERPKNPCRQEAEIQNRAPAAQVQYAPPAFLGQSLMFTPAKRGLTMHSCLLGTFFLPKAFSRTCACSVMPKILIWTLTSRELSAACKDARKHARPTLRAAVELTSFSCALLARVASCEDKNRTRITSSGGEVTTMHSKSPGPRGSGRLLPFALHFNMASAGYPYSVRQMISRLQCSLRHTQLAS